MIDVLHVLSIGSIESHVLVHSALHTRIKCHFFTASGIRDLYTKLQPAKIDVAILHDTLPTAEIRDCTTYIRHHWPHARILLIHTHAGIVDDPMYDERVLPESLPDELLTVIERLMNRARQTLQ